MTLAALTLILGPVALTLLAVIAIDERWNLTSRAATTRPGQWVIAINQRINRYLDQ